MQERVRQLVDQGLELLQLGQAGAERDAPVGVAVDA